MRVTEFLIKVEMEDDGSSATVTIGADPAPPDLGTFMAAAENFANLFALHGDDYDKSLELLCEGARKIKTMTFNGRKVQ